MKTLRILALVHDHLVPPEDTTGIDILEAEWKMEYDVIETLKEIGHDVRVLGIHDDLIGIRPTIGLTSRSGIVPLFAHNDVGGPMTRSVADAAALLTEIGRAHV